MHIFKDPTSQNLEQNQLRQMTFSARSNQKTIDQIHLLALRPEVPSFQRDRTKFVVAWEMTGRDPVNDWTKGGTISEFDISGGAEMMWTPSGSVISSARSSSSTQGVFTVL